jgi:hypothetical protein
VKRSRALRGRNPARDNRAEGRVKLPLLWRSQLARAAFLLTCLERPSHALKNPTAAPPSGRKLPTDSAEDPEFEAIIARDGTLTIPSPIADQILEDIPIRIVLFVPEEEKEREPWSQNTASEFLKGYTENDSIYDAL